MDSSQKQTQRSSDSLFDERDVTHSVETVKLCWEMEKARRRRVLLRVLLPLLLLLLAAGLYLLMRADFGRQLFSRHKHSNGSCSSELPDSTGDPLQGLGRKEGYDGAKIKVLAVIPGGTPQYADIMQVLRDAIDNKPSEFQVYFVDLFDLEEEDAEQLLGAYCAAIDINGQTEFTVPDEEGGTRSVSFLENINPKLSAPDLVTVLNQLHTQHYGPSLKPAVILPEKEPEPEGSAREALPRVVPENHPPDEESAAAESDVPVIRLPLPTMKADE
jgi:hypothetical protein